MLADVGMHLIGEIQGRRALGQDDALPLGGEGDDVLVVEGSADAFHEEEAVAVARQVLQDGLETLQPGLAPLDHAAELGVAVHAFGTDVQLLPGAGLVKELDVETLVAVVLGIVDVVVQAARTLLEMLGEDGIDVEGRILLDGIHADPLLHRLVDDADIMLEGHVSEIAVAFLHVPPDAVGLAVADVQPGVDPFLGQDGRDAVLEGIHRRGGALFVLLELLADDLIFPRAAELEGKVLELRLDTVQAQASGQGRIEEVGLAGDLHLLVRPHPLQGAHIVQAVAELDEQGPDIVMDGIEDLLVIVHLLGVGIFLFLALGDRVHEESDVVSELRADVLYGIRRVLHDVVEEGGDHGVGIQFKLLRGDLRHGDRMDDVRLPGLALLALVGLGRQGIGVLDPLQVLSADARLHHVEYVLGVFVNQLLNRFFHNQGIKIVFFCYFCVTNKHIL